MKTLNLNQMAAVEGGAEVADIIDGACAIGGVAAVLGAPVAAPALAFCAGWAFGRWLTS